MKYKLNHKLATELQLRVIREFQDTDYTLQKFAEYCTVIDQAIRSAKACLPGQNQNQSQNQNRTPGKDATDTTKDKAKATDNGAANQSAPGNTDRDRLRQEGKCFYCKESGHRAFECEKRKQDAFHRQHTVRAIESGTEQTVSENDKP